MKLSKMYIKNYKNFRDEEININDKTLIIGANDVGKSNLLKALRIILDKSYSGMQIEPEESDFNIFSNSNEIEITLEFCEINEQDDDYVVARLGKYIENNSLFITYRGYKNSVEPYKYFIGHNRENMDEIARSYITNCINCVYLDSTRKLQEFLKKSKNKMINRYKQNREDNEIEQDMILIDKINKSVEEINTDMEKISYIDRSANFLKNELNESSIHNRNLNVKLSSYNNFDDISENIDLITEVEGKGIEISGDGRSNQIYISMWINEMKYVFQEKQQFIIFLIEEPEAHLYLPLQSMTIRHIIKNVGNQVIMTTHSPKIVLEFKPNSIVRLFYSDDNKTMVANKGCSNDIKDEFLDFGYRHNLISGEMFFSDAVLLVEGYSEEMLYKFLAKQLGKDIERYNISIIPVNGVAFLSYAKLLSKLSIPFSVRTDNDFISTKNGKYSRAGVNRLIKLYNEIYVCDEQNKITEFISQDTDEFTDDEKVSFNKIIKKLNNRMLFLANKDLENDLSNSNIFEVLRQKALAENKENFIKYMQKNKAINMFQLLYSESSNDEIDITLLKEDDIFKPLNSLFNLFIEGNEDV